MYQALFFFPLEPKKQKKKKRHLIAGYWCREEETEEGGETKINLLLIGMYFLFYTIRVQTLTK